MGCLQVAVKGKSQDPQENPVARLGRMVFFFSPKGRNPTPSSLQPMPAAGREARIVGCCLRGLFWTFGAGPAFSLMLISGGPSWTSVGVPVLGGGPGYAGFWTWELVEGDILLSPLLFSIAPLHPS